jgi:hypothetical protein
MSHQPTFSRKGRKIIPDGVMKWPKPRLGPSWQNVLLLWTVLSCSTSVTPTWRQYSAAFERRSGRIIWGSSHTPKKRLSDAKVVSSIITQLYRWSVHHRKHVTSQLRTQQVNTILSISLWRRYIIITTTTLDIIHSPVFHLKHKFRTMDSLFSGGTYSLDPLESLAPVRAGEWNVTRWKGHIASIAERRNMVVWWES